MVSVLRKDNYGIGDIQQETCFNTRIAYLHPALALINREIALTYALPLKHGAPLINAMWEVYASKKDILQSAPWLTTDFHTFADKYIQHNSDHNGMGTIRATGGSHGV